jgi:hypothetical protein
MEFIFLITFFVGNGFIITYYYKKGNRDKSFYYSSDDLIEKTFSKIAESVCLNVVVVFFSSLLVLLFKGKIELESILGVRFLSFYILIVLLIIPLLNFFVWHIGKKRFGARLMIKELEYILSKYQLKESFSSVLKTMQKGPCGPAGNMAKQVIQGKADLISVSYWNGESVSFLYSQCYLHSSNSTKGMNGVPQFVFFPYPKEVEKYYAEGDLIKANDAFYCFLVRTIEEFILLDKKEHAYPSDKIWNPYHKKYYFEIAGRPTFLLAMSKTIDWVGRHINSPNHGCLIIQDHSMFPKKRTMEALRPIIRLDEKNKVSCPFHNKQDVVAYPQEMPYGTEFSELHITRMDDLTGRTNPTEPDDRWFYKQLPGLGNYTELKLQDLDKISKEDFVKLIEG